MRSLDTIPDPDADATMDPYSLREYGEAAARLFGREGVPIADAVVHVLGKSGKKFNNHHVQRVVEYANLRAFRDMRDTGLDGAKLVDFPDGPATAANVLSRLRASEVKMGTNMLPLTRAPTGGGMTKAASLRLEGSMAEMDLQLKEAAVTCRAKASNAGTKCAALLQDVCRYAEHEIRSNGATLGDIHVALAAGSRGNAELVKVAMDLVLAQVAPRYGLSGELGNESMTKRASAVNPDHPLVRKMQELLKLSESRETSARAAQLLDQERRGLRAAAGG